MTEAICTRPEQGFLINSPLNFAHQSMFSVFAVQARRRHG
jgi:hypothetical protein